MAGVGPADLDLVEVHDCFTIAEIMAIEALGLVEKGKGGKAAEAGETAHRRQDPGQYERRTQVARATRSAPRASPRSCEVTEQLRGECGDRQVKDAKRGLTQNMGGTGASSVVHILEVA